VVIPTIPAELLRSGREYHVALTRLGLNPEGVLWVFDLKAESFKLWIIWSGVDTFGPVSIFRQLFKARNVGLLPSGVDPFAISVRSTDDVLVRKLMQLHSELSPDDFIEVQFGSAYDPAWETGLYWSRDWVYHLTELPNTKVELNEAWSHFQEEIQAVAA
jgi:hypothetical protein